MDEATKQALNEFVLKIISAAQTGAQWTVEQAPILVQQWLQWQFWSNVVDIALSVTISTLVLVVFLVGRSKIYAKYREQKAQPEGRYYRQGVDWEAINAAWIVAGGVFTTLITVMNLYGIWSNLLWLVKLQVAPNVVVFEKFVELVK